MASSNGSAVPCAILGSGNIGTDLMVKVGRSTQLRLTAVVGIDAASDGLSKARAAGYETSSDGVDWLIERPELASVVFDATSASAHTASAPRLAAAGIQSVDLTPAKLGPAVVPAVNLHEHRNAPDVNLVTCGGQATIPVVYAVSSTIPLRYAETVSTVASASAGPGTRQNIDEFTRVTATAVREIGGAAASKSIIILNPADPPILMRNTVICEFDLDAGAVPDHMAIFDAITRMVARIAAYVPGYRLSCDPLFSEDRVEVFVEVTGAGDYLPYYAGNLDIMTAAAVRVGEALAESRSVEGGGG